NQYIIIDMNTLKKLQSCAGDRKALFPVSMALSALSALQFEIRLPNLTVIILIENFCETIIFKGQHLPVFEPV
ncbi:MAG: hypothetical protein LBP63_05935, partial [Prevotellaceae bacterium]|nr:hypothetical protein [Prevotellaceae bacterium]